MSEVMNLFIELHESKFGTDETRYVEHKFDSPLGIAQLQRYSSLG